MAIPFWMALTALEYGEWLTEQGRVEDAKPMLDEARAVSIGSKPCRGRSGPMGLASFFPTDQPRAAEGGSGTERGDRRR